MLRQTFLFPLHDDFAGAIEDGEGVSEAALVDADHPLLHPVDERVLLAGLLYEPDHNPPVLIKLSMSAEEDEEERIELVLATLPFYPLLNDLDLFL